MRFEYHFLVKVLCDLVLVIMMLVSGLGTRPSDTGSYCFSDLVGWWFRWEGWRCYAWLLVFFILNANVLASARPREADVVELVDTLL